MAGVFDPRSPGEAILFSHGDTAYEFFQDLGTGRNGERVLLARPRTPTGYRGKVVLKCVALPAEPLPEKYQRTRARLEEEVRLAQYLHHPNIARVHGLFEMKYGLCAAMECVEGFTLDSLLSIAQVRGRYFSESFVVYVGAEVAAALAYAHTRTDEAGTALGIVNRDVNPTRIRLRPGGEVALTDFGVAFSRLGGRVATTLPRPPGDAIYAAPEALLGQTTDARADLFSLGLTLLEFATGRHLYDPGDRLVDEDDSRLLREKVLAASVTVMEVPQPAIVEDAVRHAMAFRVKDVERATFGLSKPLRTLLHKLLRREKGARLATAAELEAELRALLTKMGPYSGADAVKEVQQALVEGGEALEELDLLEEDEGGICPAFPPLGPDDIRTEPRPLRDVDETPTEPGNFKRERTPI
ncbi:MAG: serine/threonine protein kinase [Myxococcaceae bacterium]|nr:MAG: serine/threonine protein kinase [Myxococcaceae bacterium]